MGNYVTWIPSVEDSNIITVNLNGSFKALRGTVVLGKEPWTEVT